MFVCFVPIPINDAAGRCQCVNSVPRRMSGALAPRSAIPHVSRPGCEPARCVHRAASGSRRQGVVGVDYPDADSCPRRMSRTHARTGGRRANGAARLPLCRSASRFKLAWQSSAFLEADGRSAYHRTQTVAAACNPLGATTIVLHSRKEGTFVRPSQRACFRCGSFPLIPTPVSASRTLPCGCRARRGRELRQFSRRRSQRR